MDERDNALYACWAPRGAPVGRLARQHVIVEAYRYEESRDFISRHLRSSSLKRPINSQASSYLSEVKSVLTVELVNFFASIDHGKLRYQRPMPFVFFFGGAFRQREGDALTSLRDYLIKVRKIEGRIQAEIVLAEYAKQIYRDTNYHDLISFEEDIAYLSSIVLLIAESAGSLAELGAFASTEGIREALRVVITTGHAEEDSFVRYGPIERLKKINSSNMAVFPWRQHKNGALVKSSASPHYQEIVNTISRWVRGRPISTFARNAVKIRVPFILMWTIYISLCVKTSDLIVLVKSIDANLSDIEIHNQLYCLRVGGMDRIRILWNRQIRLCCPRRRPV